MIAASELRPEDSVSLAEPPRDECCGEECSNEDDIPHLSVEPVVAQLQPSAMPSNAVASTSSSTSNAGAPCPHPRPLLKALTLVLIGCAKKEELLTSSDEEESLAAYSLMGKIRKVWSHVSLKFSQYIQLY